MQDVAGCLPGRSLGTSCSEPRTAVLVQGSIVFAKVRNRAGSEPSVTRRANNCPIHHATRIHLGPWRESGITTTSVSRGFKYINSNVRFIYGSRERLASILNEEKAALNFQVPPCCCCMPCLPKASPSERNLKIMECFSLQGPIIRAVIVVINCHFVAEKQDASEHFLIATEVAGILSLLFTLFGSHTMAKLTTPYVQQYKCTTMFRFVDISLALSTAQLPLIFDLIFVKLGVITCGPLMSALYNAKFIYNFVLICECFFMSLLASYLLAPEK
ncbi:hypothetical protein Y032_0072g698 [Ancylostoma ceylanicum]|nr:hypothetical protein Y032_0072g698 [Ancylostoma ceylanicum]